MAKTFFTKTIKWLLRIIAVLVALATMLLMFSAWQATQRETKSNIEAAPAAGKFVRAADIQVYVQEAGPSGGIPVLLVHGTGAWSEIWRETMTLLSENGFRAVAIDLPPFGFSEKAIGAEAYGREKQARRIIGVLDSLGIERVNLVAHSVGSRPSMEAAINAQGRVKNLVLVDPALGFAADGEPRFQQNDANWLTRSFFELKPLRNAVLAAFGTNPLLTKKLFQSFVWNKATVTDERVTTMQKPLVVHGATSALGDSLEYLVVSRDASMSSDFSNFKSLRMPVAIIWGSADDITPLWQGEKLRALIPGSELKVMPSVGHVPHIEDAENFNRLLLAFLQEYN